MTTHHLFLLDLHRPLLAIVLLLLRLSTQTIPIRPKHNVIFPYNRRPRLSATFNSLRALVLLNHIVNLAHAPTTVILLLVGEAILLLHSHALEVLVLALLQIAELVRRIGIGAFDLVLRDVLLKTAGILEVTEAFVGVLIVLGLLLARDGS